MSEIFDEAVVRKVAKLARLSPSDEEIKQLQVDLGQILSHFESLEHLDTTGVEPAYHPHGLENQLRPDVVLQSIDREDLMNIATRHKDGCLMVPRTVE